MGQLFEAEVGAAWPTPVSYKADLGSCSLSEASLPEVKGVPGSLNSFTDT